jgi:probable HAF family extracellular repeat protein
MIRSFTSPRSRCTRLAAILSLLTIAPACLLGQAASPAISNAPSNQTAGLGCSASFSVTATGQPVSYSWFMNGQQLADGTLPDGSVVSSSNTATITVSNVQADENFSNFLVAVVNVYGTATSGNATLVLSAPPSQALYAAVNLGTLGGDQAFGEGISINGTVVGYSYVAGDDAYFAFSYSGGEMTNLGTVQTIWNSTGSIANAINNAGTVVGHTLDSNNGQPFADSNGVMVDLNLSIGTGVGNAQAINDNGVIAGTDQGSIAFSYSNGITTELGTLGGSTSYGHSINISGTIVGWSDLPAGTSEQHAFRYSAGTMTDLGTLGGLNSYAYGINNADTIVGTSWLTGNGGQHAFKWGGGYMNDLGSLNGNGGNYSIAYAISQQGIIIGSSNTTSNSGFNDDAIVYTFGSMYDLNSLVSLPGVSLSAATAVNDYGQIVANSTNNQAYLLTPIPGAAAAITAQPISVAGAPGSTVAFAVGSSGAGVAFQWYVNGVAVSDGTLVDGSTISGSSTSTLTLTNLQPGENGETVTVVASNALASVTSSPATLAVVSAPVLTLDPTGLTDITGVKVALFAAASGLPAPTFQWQLGATQIPGATSDEYTFTLSASTAGNYTVVASNSAGSATSSPATLAIGPGYTFTTLAGKAGSAGSRNGTGASARFSAPKGRPAVDLAGNVYFSDSGNNTIRKVTPEGVVTTLAGTAGVTGSADGTGPAAQFNSPFGVSVDPQGNVYVADAGNGTIRMITPGGVVTTIAGTPGVIGSADGVGPQAQFNQPYDVPLDAQGNLFVPDLGNDTLREVSPTVSGGMTTWTVTTLAGSPGNPGWADGVGPAAQFWYPSGAVVAANGTVYVADSTNSEVREVVPSISGGATTWTVTTIAGVPSELLNWQVGQLDGTGPGTTFAYCGGVAVDGYGNVFVADSVDRVMREISPTTSAGTTTWTVTTIAGMVGVVGSENGAGANVGFGRPTGVAIDAAGKLYVVDTDNDLIRVGTPQGFTGTPVITSQPASQTVDQGSSVTLTVTALGTGTLDYQWYLDGAPLTGATKSTLTINSVKPVNAGSYTVVVTDLAGSATSNAAVLIVDVAPAITTQPLSQTVDQGGTATFTVVASGNPAPSYQWYLAGAVLPGATSASLTLNNVQANEGGAYTVTATNLVGTAASKAAVLTVDTDPVFTTQPESQTVVAGTNVTFTAVAAGFPAPTYQWTFNGAPIAGGKTGTLTLSNVKAASAGSYVATATNAAGSTTSATASLTVIAPPAITTQPVSQKVAAGSTVTFSVVATGTPVLAYQWAFDGSPIPGATSSSLTLTAVQQAAVGDYAVTVTNSGGIVISKDVTLNLM